MGMGSSPTTCGYSPHPLPGCQPSWAPGLAPAHPPAHLVRDALVALPDGRALAVPPRLAAKGPHHQQQLLPRHLAPQEEHQALHSGWTGWAAGGAAGQVWAACVGSVGSVGSVVGRCLGSSCLLLGWRN